MIHVKKGLFLLASVAILSGCATSMTEMTVDTSDITLQSPVNATKSVFIRDIQDDRVFDPETDDPSVPSLRPANEYDKDHAIGRKRNTYGKALGSLHLKPEQSVKQLTRDAVAQAYIDNGYAVVTEKNDVKPETLVVDVKIKKFWAWMDPGFWAIKLNHKIEADIQDSNGVITPSVYYGEHFQYATEGNWFDVINKAYKKFIQETKRQIDQKLNHQN